MIHPAHPGQPKLESGGLSPGDGLGSPPGFTSEIGTLLPLAIVIIGGLIASTLLSRFVTPAAYVLLAESDEAFERRDG